MADIRLAIAGMGNCASALVQGITYYGKVNADGDIPGIMHARVGAYAVGDVKVVAAFDVDAAKVGNDVAHAIFQEPNNTARFQEVPLLGVNVQRGPTLDGLGEHYRRVIKESELEPVDVAGVLREQRVDVLVSYLPVGSEHAQKAYAQACLDAGVGFVNAIPVFIASDPEWSARFAEAGQPLIGDDIKSQVGATILHRVLLRLFEDRGIPVEHTYQLNTGGNMDFSNMREPDRVGSKRESKLRSVLSELGEQSPAARGTAGAAVDEIENVHAGPADIVPWLKDRKVAFIRVEGSGFGGLPVHVDAKIDVWDSPNSAGVVIDAIRCAQLARDRGIGGALAGPCAAFMKSPPEQFHDDAARRLLDGFIAGNG